eukprot:2698942-Lingulodinium_polyedra.AAC.1
MRPRSLPPKFAAPWPPTLPGPSARAGLRRPAVPPSPGGGPPGLPRRSAPGRKLRCPAGGGGPL